MNSGIYKITNTVNGKFYIGSSQDTAKRIAQHRSNLKCGRHKNKYLQASYNKHEGESFLYETIEQVPLDKLLEVEQKYLDSTRCYNRLIGYNMAKQAEAPYSTSNQQMIIVYKDGGIASVEPSIGAVAKRLDVHRRTIELRKDTGRAIGFKGNYKVYSQIEGAIEPWKSRSDKKAIRLRKAIDKRIVVSMNGLYHEIFPTLEKAGDFIGVTKERVRQIVCSDKYHPKTKLRVQYYKDFKQNITN